MQDPRGNVTAYGYDNRNRRTSVTDALSQTTGWQYDPTNNLTRETRPDQSFRRVEFDSMNRVIDTYGFAGEHTHYDRDLAGNVQQLIDPKGAGYTFYYDAMNRKASEWYPPDATNVTRYDSWQYDVVGNVIRHDNPAGQVQIFNYDERNRLIHSYWWDYVGQDITTTYDDASRVTGITTKRSEVFETSIAFGYDDANRKVWEDQTLAGYPTRRVNTPRDEDGNRASLRVDGYYDISYSYTQRNQLASIPGVCDFTYDGNGNMTRREGHWLYPNGANFAYDALNRVTMAEQGTTGWTFARSWYRYDNLGRTTATWRDEQSSKGEHYGYDPMGQLTQVLYNADQVWDNPVNPTRSVTYDVDALNRNSVTDNGGGIGYSHDSLNQYTSVGGLGLGYDEKFNLTSYNGASYSYDASNRLVGGSLQCTYDGLGRCVRRVTPSGTLLFTYDGWSPMLEWDGAGNRVAWNIYGARADEILARWSPSIGALLYKQDKNGNVAFLLDGNGSIIEKYSYDAFGQPTITDWYGNPHLDQNGNPKSAYGNRFMFQGREYLSELAIYDYRNRFYHPGLGRFLQSDPIGFAGGDANLFRYCAGDPVNRSDPSGLDDKIRRPEAMQTATTDRVVVEGHYDFSNNPNGFREVTDKNGGLEFLNQGGGRNSGGGGGGGRALPRLARDSSGRGTVPAAPRSTQGFWTDLSGLPTGHEIYILTDAWLQRVLGDTYDRAAGIPDRSYLSYALFMYHFDTEFYADLYKNAYFQYEGRYTDVHGTWLGLQVNYIGVGEGFAARGRSTSQMNDAITLWNSRLGDTLGMMIGKYPWANVGYQYFLERSHAGH